MMKQLGILLVAIIVAVTLIGCGKGKRELTFWVGGAPDEVDYLESLINHFSDSTGIKIRVVRQPTDSDQRRQELVISLQAKQPDPDVFLMDVIWIGQFQASGWLEPFDTYLAKDSMTTEPFFQRVVDLVDVYDDSVYALPVYVDGGLLYYRTDLLNKYGFATPPKTWGKLVDYAEKVQKAERQNDPEFDGFVWEGAQYEGLVCTFLEFTASNGGGIEENGLIALDRPQNVEALRFMQDLIHRYKVSPPNTYTEMKEEEVRRTFQRGDALFERNWPYAWKLHEADDSPVKGEVGISALPHFENHESASTLGGWHIGMSKYSDVKNEAWQVIRYMLSYGTQKKLVLNLGWNPGRRDLYDDPEVLKQLPHLAKLRDVFLHAVARPNLPYYTQVSAVIQRYVNNCLAAKIDPADALRQAQKEIDRVTADYQPQE
jgi:multiple sugar transport system substrate-binding protein